MKKTLFFIGAVLSVVILTGCTDKVSGKDNTEQTTSKAVQNIESATDFEYTAKNGTLFIDKYTGKETSVVIPSEIEGYAVTGVSVFFLRIQTLRK